MNLKRLMVGLLLTVGLLTSCIREEALNTEADIETITLQGDVMSREAVFGDVEHTDDGSIVYPVLLYVKAGTDLTDLVPVLTLTEGATVEPASGEARDFTTPQNYTVTSQDGQWQRHYRVTVTASLFSNTHYSFEHVRLGGTKGQYHVFYETDLQDENVPVLDWASGNSGYALTDYTLADPSLFPTYQDADGYEGHCAVLTTRSTGSLGVMVNKPIAAGNLFLGNFELADAMADALTATKFGVPFERIPLTLSGWYKFRRGETFYVLDPDADNHMRPVPDRQDRFDIYGIFYESTSDCPILDATNALAEDNEQVISVARIAEADAVEADEWTHFELPFVMRPGKTIDHVKLADGVYNLAIVFASSVRGDYFEGAPGSTLWIDEVELECEPVNQLP